MVLLLSLKSFGFSLKSPHHHHYRRHRCRHMSEVHAASLQAFRSKVSSYLRRLSDSDQLELLSLRWIHKCFSVLDVFNDAFAKLMVEIKYPTSEWEADCVEEYLDYTISFLELLNSVSSSLSHLNHARFSLSHALIYILKEENSTAHVIKPMKYIQTEGKRYLKDIEFNYKKKKVCTSEKELIFSEAMATLKSVGLWVFGVALSCLNGDVSSFMKMRRCVHGNILRDSSLTALDSVVEKEIVENEATVKEVKEVNEMVVGLVNGSDVAKELQERLKVIEELLKGLKEEEDDLFSKVLAGRNEVLQVLRSYKL